MRATANGEHQDAIRIRLREHIPDHEIEQRCIGAAKQKHQRHSHRGGSGFRIVSRVLVHRQYPLARGAEHEPCFRLMALGRSSKI